MKKIMVVDDEPDQTFTLKHTLNKVSNEFEIIPSNSGMDCLQKLKNNIIPDLILLDIMMPGMSGWEVYDRIKSDPNLKDIPVVFLTARTDNVAKTAGGFLGEDYIEKPYDTQYLIKRINSILENK